MLGFKERLSSCQECPWQCGVNRLQASAGICKSGAEFSVGSICRHRGEEPVFGPEGICNVFFTRCNLHCCFCQNYQISNQNNPQITYTLSLEETVQRITGILDQGLTHVGFVSPSHMLVQMEELMEALIPRHPIFVMNTNAYDKVEQIARLHDRMHVYLPDMKYMDAELAQRYSNCSNYPEIAGQALKEMFRQKGSTLVMEKGIIKSGLIIRHLVLPGQIENSKAVLRFIARELSPDVTVSVMSQYTPTPQVCSDPLLGRQLTQEEYDQVLEEMDRLGMENGWVQELASQDNYVPDFARHHPFEG